MFNVRLIRQGSCAKFIPMAMVILLRANLRPGSIVFSPTQHIPMKKKLCMLLLLAGLFSACDDNDEDITDGSAVEFNGKNAVIRSDNMSNLRFKNLPGSIFLDETAPEGQIGVEASEDLSNWLEARTEGGELRLEGKGGLPANLDLQFHIHPRDIARIVVEGDRRILITSTPVMDRLELVTEGSSELVIAELKVRHLKSRREGKSRMLLSNELIDFRRERPFFLASAVQVLDDRFIIYRENELDYLLWAPRVEFRNDSVFAVDYDSSNPLRGFFLTQTHEMVNQGESYLNALELPTLAVTSRNEGESESRVWAVGQLNVKGEGESTMYYFGVPQVNQDMKGSSRLISLP